MGLLSQLLNAYAIVIVVRIIFTWFPIQRGTMMAQVYSVLYRVTEPVLGPVRRIVPPLGMLDISPMVVLFGLWIVAAYLR